jgi:hypothetical protein
MKTYGGVDAQLHHSRPRHWMEVSDQLRALVAFTPGEVTDVPVRLDAKMYNN